MDTSSTQWKSGTIMAECASMPWLLPQPPQRAELYLVVELYDLGTGRAIASVPTP